MATVSAVAGLALGAGMGLGTEVAEPSPARGGTHASTGVGTGAGPVVASTRDTPSYPIRASGDGASLVDADGQAFLYLADTVWLAPSRLDQAGVRHLLDVRAGQGFTTVQVSVLPFVHLPGGLANAQGDVAVQGTDLSRPVEVGGRTGDAGHAHYDYWDHLDWMFVEAARRGMQLTVVPSWYGYLGEDWRGYVDVDSARAYGRFLGERLGHHRNLVWLLGGDNRPWGDVHGVPRGGGTGHVAQATRVMAQAIGESEAVPHLMSYHASRGVDSVEVFAGEDWHTFASAYSDAWTWRNVTDSRGTGVPVVLTEAFYDGREKQDVLDRQQLRAQGWWSVLGGAGFAYGHEDVWDLDPGHGPESDGGADTWQDSLTAASAADMTVLASTVEDLMPLRPYDELFSAGRGADSGRASAALSADGRTALVYLAERRALHIRSNALGRRGFTASWMDPTDGTERPAHASKRPWVVTLRPPADLDDAVLVLRRR